MWADLIYVEARVAVGHSFPLPMVFCFSLRAGSAPRAAQQNGITCTARSAILMKRYAEYGS